MRGTQERWKVKLMGSISAKKWTDTKILFMKAKQRTQCSLCKQLVLRLH